ncbi:MauE/DoxX family redox-associated membrane protein [Brumimicrobium mesophilum]|uniref:MauE/DoxX family redox-associated membrane protein n=1 Tax=Brumimicrobium mesophilum TaxID=392717 RepID=UPI000D13F764|nr:DoxX family protein [Brumimicrobium mesophilum]
MLRNTNFSISGKSLIVNIILVTVNLIGLSMLVMGYHPSFEESAFLLKILGYVLMGASLIAAFLFEGMILFAYIARVLVGGLFIVSGLIKANDPKGFAYKLEEYFEDGALAYRIKEWFNWETFSLEYLIEHALFISVLICIFEIVLGALIILGAKIKGSSWLMLIMMVFFTFLTWHTKECDPHTTFTDLDTYEINSSAANAKIPQAANNENITILSQTAETVTIREVKKPQCVDDCGCFGDAMKGSIRRSLTPAESFWKDIVLLYLVIIIFISRRKITNNNPRENVVMISFGLIFIGFFSFIFTWGFPIIFGLACLLLALWIRKTGGKWLGNDWGMILMMTIVCSLFVTYVLMYLPMRDYRPYHVGSNLRERMVDGVDGEYENFMVYTNLKTKQDTMITNLDETTQSIWGDTETWKFAKRETKTIKAAIPHAIQQFDPTIPVDALTSVEKDFAPITVILDSNKAQYIDVIDKETGDRYPMSLADFHLPDIDTAIYAIGDTIIRVDESLTDISLKDYILDQDQVILVFSRNLSKGDFSRISRLKEIAAKAKENNIDMIMISTASQEEIIAFREETGLNIPTLQNDEIEIKAITRSNPTLMVLSNSVVKGKFPFRSTPSWEWLIENVLKVEE